MPVVARVTNKTNYLWAALVACFVSCAFGGKVTAPLSPREVTLRLEPLKAAVKKDEEIGMRVVFVGGVHETTLILPAGADASGMITYSCERGGLQTGMDGGKARLAQLRRGLSQARPRRWENRTAVRCA